MGNAAAKQVQEATLSAGSLSKEKAVDESVLSTEDVTANSKGNSWMDASTQKLLWKAETKGIFRKHCLVKKPDAAETVYAYIITEKSGISTITNWICKLTPTYDGQDTLTDEELKKAGIETGIELYKFSKFETKRQISAAESTYSVVTGPDAETVVYKAEKLAALGYLALFKQVDGDTETLVAKAATVGMSMTPTLYASKGVDLLAIISMGATLVSNEGTAGALVGAGVI